MKNFFNAFLGVLGKLLALFWEFLEELIDALGSKHLQGSEWGKASDIGSPWNHGLLYDNHRRLSRAVSHRNVLLCAPTGSGKTTAYLIKQPLVLKGVTMLITDPSREIFNLTSGYTSQHSAILSLNFSNFRESIGINFLDGIDDPDDSRVVKIVDMLLKGSLDKEKTEQFWVLSVKSLLAMLIRLVIYEPKEKRHMASVLRVLNTFATDVEKLDLAFTLTRNDALIEQYKTTLAVPERTAQNVIASARAALECFESKSVQKVTSHQSISFAELRRTPHILYLHHNVSESKMYANLIGLFFELFYTHILDTPLQPEDLDCYVLLEETTNTYIPILSKALSMTRKTRVSNFLCIQSQSQLRSQYHDESTNIMENCQTKIFLSGISDLNTLTMLESLGGRRQVKNPKTGHHQTVPLIEAYAARTIEEGKALILSGRNPLIQSRMSGYYKSRKYRKMASLPPAMLSSDIPEGPIPMIEFPTLKEQTDEN